MFAKNLKTLTSKTAVFAGGLLFSLTVNADITGNVSTFTSPGGVTEQCIAITPMPSAHYSKRDHKTEQEYCEIDFSKVALCPKLWSTSPATNIFSINVAEYNGDFTAFERQNCSKGHHVKDVAIDKLATFKVSVNTRDSSATYAPSSWIYYHLSRYFSTATHVPVAVYRSVDKQVHDQRVVKPALDIVSQRHGLKMLTAGWTFLEQAETSDDPASASSTLLTDNGKQVFGVLLDNKGDRYGVEINGTRESGWGEGQNHDFQQTAPYLALRSDLPLDQAIPYGIKEARTNPKMSSKLSADTDPTQMAFWMNDILEITLLDYILGQQDRVGNIDYRWRWFWLQDGKIHSESANKEEVPIKFAAYKPVRLKETAINDNDAGVRRGYANFALKTDMLNGFRHYNPHLYKKLAKLAQDLESKGEIYQWFVNSSRLSSKEIESIVERTSQAYALLKTDHDSCKLKLDLDPRNFLYDASGKQAETPQPCVPAGS